MEDPYGPDPVNNESDSTLQADTSQSKLSYLALGDSYTIGESVPVADRWPVQLAGLLNSDSTLPDFEEPVIIARTGWRTDDLIKAITAAHPPSDFDLVSLLIGVNNQYQNRPVEQYTLEFEVLLKTAIEKAGGRKDHVFVVSIPDYGFTTFGRGNQENISKAIDQYNAIARTVCTSYDVKYYYITDLSRNGLSSPDLVASDGLHPSGKQYGLWVKRIINDTDFFRNLE